MPVRAPVRCGIVVIRKAQSEASALLVQTAFEQIGGQAFRAWADGDDAKQETSALQMFSKFCDLILVVGARDDGAGDCAGGLCIPRVFTVAESCVCVDLPAEPQAALGSFVSFVVPLVRRLQGRPALPAPPRRAIDESSTPICDGEIMWASARGEGASLRVRARQPLPGHELQSLAGISGIAWKVQDIAAQRAENAVALFLPLHEWLD